MSLNRDMNSKYFHNNLKVTISHNRIRKINLTWVDSFQTSSSFSNIDVSSSQPHPLALNRSLTSPKLLFNVLRRFFKWSLVNGNSNIPKQAFTMLSNALEVNFPSNLFPKPPYFLIPQWTPYPYVSSNRRNWTMTLQLCFSSPSTHW